MISKIKIFFMVLSLIILIAVPALVVAKYKKDTRLGHSLLAGLGIFFLFSVIMSIISGLLFGQDGIMAIDSIMLKSSVQAVLVSLSMTLALYGVLKWYRKSEVTNQRLLLVAVLFTFFSSMMVILGLFSNITFAMTANQGNLSSLVSETHSLETLTRMAQALNDESILMTLYWSLDRILDIVVIFVAIYFVNKSFELKDLKYLAITFIYVSAVRSLTNFLILSFDGVQFVFVFQIWVAVASIYYLYKFEGVSHGSHII